MKVYHAGYHDYDKFDVSKTKRGTLGPGMYVTKDRNESTYYGNIVKEYELPDKIKLFTIKSNDDTDRLYNMAKKAYKAKFGKDINITKKTDEVDGMSDSYRFWQHTDDAEGLKAKALMGQELQKQGYQGIETRDGNITLFNPDVVKNTATWGYDPYSKEMFTPRQSSSANNWGKWDANHKGVTGGAAKLRAKYS